MLSGRGLCDEPITRPEECYRLWCVVVCDLETSWIGRPWPTGDCRAKNKQTNPQSNHCWWYVFTLSELLYSAQISTCAVPSLLRANCTPKIKRHWQIHPLLILYTFLFSHLIPHHNGCRWLLLHLITLNDTHSVESPWMRDRPIADISTCSKHNIHDRQTFMPPAEFEPAIPASEWTQTYALDRAATGIGFFILMNYKMYLHTRTAQALNFGTKCLLSF